MLQNHRFFYVHLSTVHFISFNGAPSDFHTKYYVYITEVTNWPWCRLYSTSAIITALARVAMCTIIRWYAQPCWAVYSSPVDFSKHKVVFKMSSSIYWGRLKTVISVNANTTSSERDNQYASRHGFVATSTYLTWVLSIMLFQKPLSLILDTLRLKKNSRIELQKQTDSYCNPYMDESIAERLWKFLCSVRLTDTDHEAEHSSLKSSRYILGKEVLKSMPKMHIT